MVFVRNQENFVCEECGAEVTGNGYTNHCPNCLWSKHVDVEPGDRAANCGGMMEPVSLEGTTGAYRIVHCCVRCKLVRRNKAAANDGPDALIRLAESSSAHSSL